jgi:hypothetical protein
MYHVKMLMPYLKSKKDIKSDYEEKDWEQVGN